MLRFVHHVKPSVHDILPAPYDRQGTRPAWLRWHNRRYTRFAFLTLVALSVLAILRGFNVGDGLLYIADPPENHIFPPLYPQYHESELRLSQHDPGLPYPEGREGKFLFMANHVHASGWGNVMQELLLNSYLAYKSERAFVFDNYTWNRDGSDYTDYNGKLIPSRVPLSALIQGPTVGSPFPPGDPAPRAVIKEYWDQVCPHPTVIFSDEVTNTLPGDASAQATLDAWVEKLNSMSDRCVEIDRESAQIFSIWIFGSTRALDIFPDFAKSPIMTQFRWSPLVEDAFKANRPIFSPEKGLQSYFPLFSLFSGDNAPYTMLPGLLVLHVRRGDFADHCMHLARWSSRWNGFNSFTELPDQFEPPPGAGWGENTDENKALYMKRCFPTIAQIVARVEEVRQTPAGIGLKNVYIMTNGAKEWVDELKKALKTTGHFERVTGSRDLRLSWEQKYVAQSVDMLIGQRAQVLIGNGFSSLTSNIVMMRMAMGLSPNSTRFW
ncbi:uncharacterized protein FIBRA_04862 [Fibroporia radiculosa]|uniref:Uncharacterized protein n=1 Tax=Fibroporia radiculosa TaxID=599839 RepID=J4H369_9APHY|nr:uncharacterized protein FIBRA_04862 [Fibroporia radiculosa]CCM02754.1 predicted protein [Fibroporia radiculosa]